MSAQPQHSSSSSNRRLVSFAYSNNSWKHVSTVPSHSPQQQGNNSASNNKQQPQPQVVVPGGGWGSQELRSYNTNSSSTGGSDQHTSYRILALFEGNFDAQGRRHGWGTVRVFRSVGRTNTLVCVSVACRWEADVPQIEWDPCRHVEEIVKNPQEFIAISSEQQQPACELYNDSGRRLASVYNGLMLAISQDFTSDRYTGLEWAMSTQFLPHTLGEKHDLIAMPQSGGSGGMTTAGVKYCGQYQMGERSGFGMERQLSTGGLIYAGPYEGNERHGVALYFNPGSRTCLDATWSHGNIADCPGALHVQGFPISVLGRWSGDSAVAQGRLVRANGASGIWETLFAEFDEQMPSLHAEVENLIAATRNNSASPLGKKEASNTSSSSPLSTPQPLSEPSFHNLSFSDTANAASAASSTFSGTAPPANLSPALLGAMGTSHIVTTPLPQLLSAIIANNSNHNTVLQSQKDFVTELCARLSLAKEEVMCVCEPIGVVLAMPQMRALLAVFQRCFLFSYGTCSPGGEDVGAGPMTALDMASSTPPSMPTGEEEAALVAAAAAGATMGTNEVAAMMAALASSSEFQQQQQQQQRYAADETDDVFLAPKASMSWCTLAVRDMCQRAVIPNEFKQLSQQSHLLCIHRARAASRDSELEMFQRAVEDATALVISVRLRLMNLVNSTLAGGAGSGPVSSPTSLATAASIISGPGSVDDSALYMTQAQRKKSSLASSGNILAHHQKNGGNNGSGPNPSQQQQQQQQHTLEELSFAAALRDPSVAPFFAGGTPLAGSARAAACAWDAVLDVALAPLLKHASNVCRIENAKFLVAARRLVVNCGSSNRVELQQSDMPHGQRLPPLLAVDLISILIPSDLVQKARFGDAADVVVVEKPEMTRQQEAQKQLRTTILSFSSQLIVACKLMSNVFTEGQLSEMHMACASESTQAGLLFGFFRRFNRSEQHQQQTQSSSTPTSTAAQAAAAEGKQRLRSSKSQRLKRIGVDGAVSSLVGAATSCCICVREAAHSFANAINAAMSQMQDSNINHIHARDAFNWGLRFVICYGAINASSPRAILPQLLLLDTICEAEASEIPHPTPIDEMCCSLFGMWRGDLPGIAAVPLGTGAAFPVTLLGQWSIRSLRSAVAEVTSLCNTPSPLRKSTVSPTATCCSGAVFVHDLKNKLSTVLRDIARPVDMNAHSFTSNNNSSSGASSSSSPPSSSREQPAATTFDSVNAHEVLARTADPMFLPRNRDSWFTAVRSTLRRSIVAERNNELDTGTTSESLGYFSTASSQQQQHAFSTAVSYSRGNDGSGGHHLHHNQLGSAFNGSDAQVADHGLASTVDKALAMLKVSSKNTVLRWAQHQQLLNPSTAAPAASSAFDGALSPTEQASPAAPAAAGGLATGAVSARGDRAASTFMSPASTTANVSTVTVPLQSDAHEAELARRLGRFNSLLRHLGLRVEQVVRRETAVTHSSSDSDENDLFGGAAAAAAAAAAEKKKKVESSVTSAVVHKGSRKMTIRILPAEQPATPSPAASAPLPPALSLFLADESEVIDEDSLEDVLEWWTGARSRIKGAVARM